MTHKTPIRRGVVTDTTKQMLEEAEREVQRSRALPRLIGEITLRSEGDGNAEVRRNVDAKWG